MRLKIVLYLYCFFTILGTAVLSCRVNSIQEDIDFYNSLDTDALWITGDDNYLIRVIILCSDEEYRAFLRALNRDKEASEVDFANNFVVIVVGTRFSPEIPYRIKRIDFMRQNRILKIYFSRGLSNIEEPGRVTLKAFWLNRRYYPERLDLAGYGPSEIEVSHGNPLKIVEGIVKKIELANNKKFMNVEYYEWDELNIAQSKSIKLPIDFKIKWSFPSEGDAIKFYFWKGDIAAVLCDPSFKTAVDHLHSLHQMQVKFKNLYFRFADFDELMKEYERHAIGYNLTIYYIEAKKDHSEVDRSGYYFGLYFSQDLEDMKKYYCIFAWPSYADNKDLPALFIDYNGKIYFTKNHRYHGPKNGPQLNEVYTGEPFKSPINTEKWKPID